MTFWKDNIFFILVEPQQPGNIGAAARALQNMGFRNLELVNPIYFRTKEARRMAYQAYNLLQQAPVYTEFDDAIHDKHLIVGTTRRLGTRRGLIVSLKDSVRRIITTAKRNKVAIVFGRERNGLTNQEVTQCGFLVTIPSEPETPSLNLAQSILLVAYELSQKSYKTASPELVKHENVIALYEKIASTLKLLAYIPRGDRDLEKQIIRNMKHLICRAGLTEWELNMLYGICSQVEKKLKESVSLGSKNLETGEFK